jgi:hypothetical protein
MNENVTPQEILVFMGIFIVMIATMLYGFFVVGVGKMPENCWDKYTTEREAIMNCEGKQ